MTSPVRHSECSRVGTWGRPSDFATYDRDVLLAVDLVLKGDDSKVAETCGQLCNGRHLHTVSGIRCSDAHFTMFLRDEVDPRSLSVVLVHDSDSLLSFSLTKEKISFCSVFVKDY